MRFTDKIALVIGGNSGIGLAAAEGLAAEGATVFLTGRSETTLAEAEAAIPGASAFRCDIADPDTLGPVLEAITARHGRIDVLMVNAGVGAFAPVRAITPEMWDEVHEVNLKGSFFAIQKALPLMGKGGSIVVTGSVGSVLGIPGNAVYAAAKAGLRAIVRILAVELVGEGIRVNMVSPGPTETPILYRSGLDEAGIAGLRAAMNAGVPMKRMGTPEEIARPMLFLASDEASFVTGIDMFVDGGSVEL
jgi:NAD(P)-dependent dehydrogenase (short-subunit alcohol dehydrogenase family)